MVAMARRHRIRRGMSTCESTAVSASKLQQRKTITHDLANRFLRVYGGVAHDNPIIERIRTLANPNIYYDTVVSITDGEADTYDIHVPHGHEYTAGGFLSHNTKIRGERAHDILCDEFHSLSWEIFETVIRGFGVVELEPVEKVMRKAEIRVLRKEGLWTSEMAEEERTASVGNQTVISGTAYYQFNHFFDYWKRWKGTIESRGNAKILQEVWPNGVDPNFDWRDYSIMRMPYDLLPDGLLNDRQVANSRATQHLSIFNNEMGAVFSADTNGFFKRSLVESCVTKEPILVDGVPVQFRAAVRGNPQCRYVYGVDPASEADRFSIVVLELHPTHQRVVYCWTTTRQEQKAKLQAGLTGESNFYSYCSRKIRDLMLTFPCEHIAMDSQGGGVPVAEALQDADKLRGGEKPILLITPDHPLSDHKERLSDALAGLHILELVNFASAQWTSEANHGMRKDFEDKILLFPEYDTALLAIAMEEDSKVGRMYDTLEDATDEVEALKDELATIVHTQTPGTFRDHWDTPEVKLAGSKKGRLRKDRYSALLMANSAARRLNRHVEEAAPAALGGFVNQVYVVPDGSPQAQMYASGPDWFINPTAGDSRHLGMAVRRGGVNR